MVSEKLLNSGARNILLASSAILFSGAGFLFAKAAYLPAIVSLITGLTTIVLVYRIYNTTNESVATFFDSLRNDDTTIHFNTGINNRTLAGLFASMNQLNEHFQEIKLRNEYNESYYKTLIQHASTGLLVLDGNNRVELINKAACNYAGISADSTNNKLLQIKHPAFYEAACKLKPGESVTYRNLESGDLKLLLFHASTVSRNNTEWKFVSIQDIRNELESRELESYRKLINVMTHEIMNLLSPLTSVSRELYSIFSGRGKLNGAGELGEENIETTVRGLQLINEHSDGLMSFVNNYRKISKIPQPSFSTFPADEWMEQIKIAFGGRMRENNIEFSVTSDKLCGMIIADKNLLNQVMINLINNATDAVMELEEGRKIRISAAKSREDKYLIRIENNGPSISPDLLEKIFVPFFTTKKNGSGIGLSISQEIMKRHNGSIIAISPKGGETSFILEF